VDGKDNERKPGQGVGAGEARVSSVLSLNLNFPPSLTAPPFCAGGEEVNLSDSC